eukprot:6213620-Amphidinium_carterae.2
MSRGSAEFGGQPAAEHVPLGQLFADVSLVDASSEAPLFLELFSYEARLSSHMRRNGFRALALDTFRKHVHFEAAVTFIDLTSEVTTSRLLHILAQAGSGVVFMQPPSDT